MTDPKAFLLKLNKNLIILREREAKYAGNAPLELLNQIGDYDKAITLTHQRIDDEINEAEWQEALKPLLVSIEAATNPNLLEAYIDQISELLLKERLLESKPDDVVRNIARTRTLKVLRGLDGEEKGILIQFLYEAGLITKPDKSSIVLDSSKSELIATKTTIVDLRMADLEGVQLKGINLWKNIDLSGANLKRANFSGTDLQSACLIYVDLREANLSHTDLSKSELIEANMLEADLTETDLSGADLRGAKVIAKQLNTAKNLKGAIMPDGTKHD
jgi:uncharacterized protein YjbI with pentapeptide repeats